MNSAKTRGRAALSMTLGLIAGCGSSGVHSSGGIDSSHGINFAPQVSYATGATTSGPGGGSGSIALADFNGDGKLDIAVSNYASNTIAVFLNKGDGSFGAPSSVGSTRKAQWGWGVSFQATSTRTENQT
jgi:hypothetical protein